MTPCLTQAVAAWLNEMTDFDGVTFTSRHGDDLRLPAIFERPGDPPVTPNIHDVIGYEPLQHDSPEISKALPRPRAAMGEQLSRVYQRPASTRKQSPVRRHCGGRGNNSGWTEPPIYQCLVDGSGGPPQ